MVSHLYRVVFLTGPPDFQYQNEKKLAQPTRSFFTLKISWKTSPGWLQPVFHFGIENRADQLKKNTLYDRIESGPTDTKKVGYR